RKDVATDTAPKIKPVAPPIGKNPVMENAKPVAPTTPLTAKRPLEEPVKVPTPPATSNVDTKSAIPTVPKVEDRETLGQLALEKLFAAFNTLPSGDKDGRVKLAQAYL